LLPVLFVILFSLLDVLGYFSGMELNFEDALIPDAGTMNGIPVGRMSPVTGTAFFLSGLSILLVLLTKNNPQKKEEFSFFSGVLNLTVFLIAFVFSLAYILGNPLLYNSESTIPMALTTSLGFIFLSFSLFSFNTNSFPLKIISGNTMRGYLLRYILPLVVFSGLFGGLIVYFSFQLIPVNPAILSSLAILLVIIAAGIVANYISHHLGSVIDGQKNTIIKSEQALIESEEQYSILFEKMAQGVVYQNAAGEIIDANTAAERILGLSLDQMKGRTSVDPRWKAVDQDKNELPGENHAAMIALKTGLPVENIIQGIFNPQKERYVWIIVNSIPQFKKGERRPYQVFSTFLDITIRKNAEDDFKELKENLQKQVNEKTQMLNERIADLESFHEATIDRELRMEELRREIERLKKEKNDK
jgi:PAS domain S-box-containing protein